MIFKKIFSKSPLGLMLYTRKFISSEKKIDYQNRFVKFDIKTNSKVLDIGSGGEPFPHATFLIDRFPGKTQHRYNELKTDNLPFSVGSVEDLPYKNKSFDFVYCAHVLEHVENPAKALNEIQRIGQSGYIEVPTKMSDIVFNFAKLKHFHKWHITKAGNTLIFVEYQENERRDTGDQEFFYMAHSLLPNAMKTMYRKNKDLFANMFPWQNSFTYYIFNKDGKLTSSNSKS
ncbi:MAG: class I SAM-dependent methyltransferase [Ignavibacteriales bacterium]|nr:class I SAM-dependent methyltransferase [Ignavibacteriales bacterium]